MGDEVRHKVIMLVFGLGAVVLMANLFRYQILDDTYSDRAQSRTLSERIIRAPRGIITDRNGELLVINQPNYELEMIQREIAEDMDKEEFCDLLSITLDDYDALMQRAISRPYFRRSIPVTFLSNISTEDFAVFQEHLHRFPGFYAKMKNKRSYPYPNAAHVLGYISEVSADDIASNEAYEIGDIKGTMGIEKVYEDDLRGGKGYEYVLRDNIGREIEAYRYGSLDQAAQGGNDITTTLDIALQSYGESLLAGKRGSIVAIDPSTGEVLSMISSPNYDPNDLSLGKERNSTYRAMLRDTINLPMFDRSLQAKYPPGSIFKPILALIAMQENTTYAKRTIYCTGEYVTNEKKGFSQGCRNHPTPYNIGIALQYSCNTYFYQVLREFLDQFGVRKPGEGLALLNQYLDAFGIGRQLGVDIQGELSGFNPPPSFYDDAYNTSEYKWRSTYILSLGIGQGELELTTLQMANLAAILANRGHYYIPHLVKSFSTGKSIDPRFTVKQVVPIDSVHYPPVIDGMESVINAGTGRRAYVPGIDICGKTGTSQNPFGEDHSVFFGFAPKVNPEIAIAVFVENAGGGGAIAAPIGGLMIEQYLNGEIRSSRKYVEDRITSINLIDLP